MGIYYLQRLKGVDVAGQELDLELLSDRTYDSFQEAIQDWTNEVAHSVNLAHQDIENWALTPTWQMAETSPSLERGATHFIHLQNDHQTLFFQTRLLPANHLSMFQSGLREQLQLNH